MKVNTITTVEITNKERELIDGILGLCDYDDDITGFMWDVSHCKETIDLPVTNKTLTIKYIEEKASKEEEENDKKRKEIAESWKVRDLLNDFNDVMSCGKCPLNNGENCEDHCINLFLDYARKYDFKFKED